MMRTTLDIGSKNQVFIDRQFLDSSAGVEIVTHEARTTEIPCLVPDCEWERAIGGYNTVLYRNGEYHLWYTVMGDRADLNCIGYAVSDDGIVWTKPSLGLATEVADGKNNIVLGFGAGGVPGGLRDISCHVFEDPNDSSGLAMIARLRPTGGLELLRSADGLLWGRTELVVLDDVREYDAEGIFLGEDFHLDSQNVVFWDERISSYVAYVRRNFSRPGQHRTIARGVARDLSGFIHPREMEVVMASDALDPTGATTSRLDFYTNAAIRYPWGQDAYLMFPAIYYKYDDWFAEAWGEDALNAGVLDVGFCASRDGISWNRFDRRPFVRLGYHNRFDSASIYMAWGIVLSHDHPNHEMFLYYSGSDHNHGWGRQDKHKERNDRILTRAGLNPIADSSGIGRVIVRRDGFTSARGDYRGGAFVTPPLRFTGYRLELNVDTSAVGEVVIEIQDDTGAPVDGFTMGDCMPIHSINDVAVPVRWRDDPSLAILAGRPVRLHVRIRNADLYSFRFAS